MINITNNINKIDVEIVDGRPVVNVLVDQFSAAKAEEAAREAKEDAEQTALDRIATGEDRVATGLDRVATGLDAIATAADRVQTGLDRIATGEDRVQTGLDRVATGNDRIATGADVVQTGLDRVQTGLDRIAAADSAASAASAALNTPLTGFASGANTTILSTDTTLQAFGKAQGQINERIGGTVGVGQVAFGTGTKVLGGDSGLVWDNVNKRLGVGTNVPNSIINALAGTVSEFKFNSGYLNLSPSLCVGNTGAGGKFAALGAGTVGSAVIYDSLGVFDIATEPKINYTNNVIGGANFVSRMRIQANGNVQIGTTTDAGFKLDVNGTARVQGELTVNGVNVGLGGGAISSNTRVGVNALQNNTTGSNNTANGVLAGLNNTTGTNNSFVGVSSGRFLADGSTALTIANNSVFLGFDTRAAADNQTNQIVIGHTAIGAGSNTATLGNTSILDTILRGRINIEQYATGSRPSYVKGALIYDSTLSKLVVGGALDWEVVTSV
jgi:hypothetical protein